MIVLCIGCTFSSSGLLLTQKKQTTSLTLPFSQDAVPLNLSRSLHRGWARDLTDGRHTQFDAKPGWASDVVVDQTDARHMRVVPKLVWHLLRDRVKVKFVCNFMGNWGKVQIVWNFRRNQVKVKYLLKFDTFSGTKSKSLCDRGTL